MFVRTFGALLLISLSQSYIWSRRKFNVSTDDVRSPPVPVEALMRKRTEGLNVVTKTRVEIVDVAEKDHNVVQSSRVEQSLQENSRVQMNPGDVQVDILYSRMC
jgi:hypothetical protein